MIQLSRLSPCCTRAEGDTSKGPKSPYRHASTMRTLPTIRRPASPAARRCANRRHCHRASAATASGLPPAPAAVVVRVLPLCSGSDELAGHPEWRSSVCVRVAGPGRPASFLQEITPTDGSLVPAAAYSDGAPYNGGTGEPFSRAETFVMHTCFVLEGTT
jgi:hypothetical protein